LYFKQPDIAIWTHPMPRFGIRLDEVVIETCLKAIIIYAILWHRNDTLYV